MSDCKHDFEREINSQLGEKPFIVVHLNSLEIYRW